MRYILDPRYRFRGWSRLPGGIFDTVTKTARFPEKDAFLLLLKCDGIREIDPEALSPEERDSLRRFEEKGVIHPAVFGQFLRPEQLYKTYPARYREEVHWSVTGACNLKCRHCFMSAPQARHGTPSREELLVAAEDREQALKTMRHEAFHQYLFYATGNGNHATWFNEGHACFFENVQYNPAKNTVRVLDSGSRAEWTARDPEKVARMIGRVLEMDRGEFYSGSLPEINSRYVAGWAIAYFLEKGAYASDEFAPYRGICAKYLELAGGGADAAEATREA